MRILLKNKISILKLDLHWVATVKCSRVDRFSSPSAIPRRRQRARGTTSNLAQARTNNLIKTNNRSHYFRARIDDRSNNIPSKPN